MPCPDNEDGLFKTSTCLNRYDDKDAVENQFVSKLSATKEFESQALSPVSQSTSKLFRATNYNKLSSIYKKPPVDMTQEKGKRLDDYLRRKIFASSVKKKNYMFPSIEKNKTPGLAPPKRNLSPTLYYDSSKKKSCRLSESRKAPT